MPVENLLTPDYLRRVAWRPPAELSEEGIAEELREPRRPPVAGGTCRSAHHRGFLNPQPLPPKEPKAPPAEPRTTASPRWHDQRLVRNAGSDCRRPLAPCQLSY